MTITVPTGAHASACPPASQDGLGALLEFLPRRVKPGIRGLLSGLDPLQPSWGHIFLREEWLTSLAKEWGIEPGLIQPGEQVPIRIAIEHDVKLGSHLVISICDNPTPAQASADADLRRRLEEGGLWRPARAPEKLRQLYALTPKTGTGHWASLAPRLKELDENRIVFLSERPVDFGDAADVLLALQDAKEFVHWTGADAVLVATGVGCAPRPRANVRRLRVRRFRRRPAKIEGDRTLIFVRRARFRSQRRVARKLLSLEALHAPRRIRRQTGDPIRPMAPALRQGKR